MCVFVGRCADHILRHQEKCLNVFIYAPSAVRLENIMKAHSLNKTDAKLLIKKSDEDLHACYKQVTGTYRGDRHNRHLLIDSSLLGIDRTAKLIEEVAPELFGIEGCQDIEGALVRKGSADALATASPAGETDAAPDKPPVATVEMGA